MTALAAMAAAWAAWWWVGPPGGRLDRLAARPADRREPPHAPRRLRGAAALAGCLLVLAGIVAGARGVALALVATLVGGTGTVLAVRHAARREQDRRREEVVHAGEVLSGLLRVGQIPATALALAAVDAEVLREAAAEQAVGGDVGVALLRASARPGQEGLSDLATAWEVASRTGASLGDALEAAAQRLADEHELARLVAAELAAARAAGRVMAVLPLVGLALGFGFGGDPTVFLTGTTPGRVCLVAGTALACAGVLWTDVIADRAGGG